MFRFAHPELLYLLIVIPLLIVFYVVMIRRKKKAIAEFGNPELLGPLMPLLSFKRGTWKFVMLMLALLFVIVGVAVRFETAAGEEKRCRVDDRSRRFQFDDGTGYQTQSFGKS